MLPVLLATATALAPVSPKIVDADNAFAADLYAVVGKSPGNVVFSPTSIATALAMTWTGARGKTAMQMEKTLHLPPSPFDVHGGYGALLSRLESSGAGDPELHVANRLFGQKGLAFEAPFLATTKAHYGAGLEALDFAGAPEPSRLFINQWVEKQTRDRIKDLLPAGAVDSSTRLVLTNAVYFKGAWMTAFDKKATRDEPFGAKKVPTMHASQDASYFEAKDAQVLELPYKRASADHAVSMVIVLPREADGAAKLPAGRIFELLGTKTFSSREVDMSIPRFKTTMPLELGPVLKSLGMIDAFGASADFGGISKTPMYISRAIHKAFVDVNEEGTEAAAATAIVMREGAAVPPPKVTFRADHPFVWALKDQSTGALLFVGRVDDPTG
ncbi:MAG: serpin family protein [Deltaproteobacteria bacterium]|nr:serpin family protein [Deltaproteobacteria bacterium]